MPKRDPQIALVVGDLGFTVVERFAERFPDRFINAGVAEQNMTGLAAGMASEGYHVFTYSIANFPTFRCAEQIRNDVDHHRLAGHGRRRRRRRRLWRAGLFASRGAGLCADALDAQHAIAAPGDPMEARACLRWLVDNPRPSYLRLGKAGEPQFHEDIPAVAPGAWVRVRERRRERHHAFHRRGAGRRHRPREDQAGLFASAVEHGGEAAAGGATGATPGA